MPLAIDASSPPGVSNASTTGSAVTASFTPPAGSLLLIMFAGNSTSLSNSPPVPTVTDSLGVHLTYNLIQNATPTTTSANVGGQATLWWASVTSSAAMTITVTGNTAAGFGQSGLRVAVITGADTASPVATSGVIGQTGSATAFSQSFTPTVAGGMGFLAMCDWSNTTATPTAGTGCTSFYSLHATDIAWAFIRRTAADDVASTANTVSGALTVGEPVLWAWADIKPSGGAAPAPPKGGFFAFL